ncbi:MAG: LysM peptidoglycan-binding domain-containing protein [Verrucomicrobia bacterium]|nr:LysM peptidoglycan-binding domain-containing protein [Verrucomicrobiota bacterium]
MDGKSVCSWLLATIAGASAVFAQDTTGYPAAKDLEAIKAQLKAQEERIDKLSQEITRLNETLKQKGIAVPGPAAPAPASTAATPASVGVENPTPAEAANTRTHTVARGETLTQIAKQFGVTVEEIKQLNKIEDAKKLQAGQTIKIPPPASGASPAASARP